MSELQVQEELDGDAVAAYLRAHPGFFAEFPGLADELELTDGNGPVMSLSGYRLSVLRRKNHDLERQLGNFIRIAGENEQLMRRVHAFNVSLMQAEAPAALVQRVVAGLSEGFAVDQVTLLLLQAFPGVGASFGVQVLAADSDLARKLTNELLDGEPRIGRLPASMLQPVFGEAAATLKSAVLLRLGKLGVLGLGSHDENRFHPGTGNMFVELIAETVTAALASSRAA